MKYLCLYKSKLTESLLETSRVRTRDVTETWQKSFSIALRWLAARGPTFRAPGVDWRAGMNFIIQTNTKLSVRQKSIANTQIYKANFGSFDRQHNLSNVDRESCHVSCL